MSESIRKRVSGNLQGTFRRLQSVYHEYSIFISISLCLGIILEVINLNHELVDHSSIISMSATLLFTVLAIIFAILIFFTQISYEYTMTNIFEEDNVKFLIVLYFTTIVFSLMMFVTTFQYPIFLFTLTLACIFSLYPFLRNISDKLVFDVGVVKLNVEIPLQIESNNEPFTSVKITSLEQICKRSIKDNRDKAFIEIMGIYENITKMAKNCQMTGIIKLIGINYSKFLECLLFTHNSSRFGELRVSLSILIKQLTSYSKIEEKPINNNVMFLILEEQIHTYVSEYSQMVDTDALKTILVWNPLEAVIKNIKDGFEEDFFNEYIVILCYKSYSKLTTRDTHKYQMDRLIIDSLANLAKESYNRNMSRLLTISIGALFEIGVKENQENEISRILSTLVINKLKEIEDYITPECFEKVYKNFNHIPHISLTFGEPELKPHFDTFKELYHKNK